MSAVVSAQADSGGRRLWVILRLPLAVFAAVLGGLATALLGEGPWHWLAWALLALPLVIILAAVVAPRRSRRSGAGASADAW